MFQVSVSHYFLVKVPTLAKQTCQVSEFNHFYRSMTHIIKSWTSSSIFFLPYRYRRWDSFICCKGVPLLSQFAINWWLKISSLSLSFPIHQWHSARAIQLHRPYIATHSDLQNAWASVLVIALFSVVSYPGSSPDSFNNARGYKDSIYHFTINWRMTILQIPP